MHFSDRFAFSPLWEVLFRGGFCVNCILRSTNAKNEVTFPPHLVRCSRPDYLKVQLPMENMVYGSCPRFSSRPPRPDASLIWWRTCRHKSQTCNAAAASKPAPNLAWLTLHFRWPFCPPMAIHSLPRPFPPSRAKSHTISIRSFRDAGARTEVGSTRIVGLISITSKRHLNKLDTFVTADCSSRATFPLLLNRKFETETKQSKNMRLVWKKWSAKFKPNKWGKKIIAPLP